MKQQKTDKPGDMYKRYKSEFAPIRQATEKMSKKVTVKKKPIMASPATRARNMAAIKNIGTTVGNAAAKMTGWPKGINDVQVNKSGTIGTEPMSRGNSKFTEVKAGGLGKLDIPMGTLKNKKTTKKKNWIAGAIKKPGALHAELGVPQGKKIPPAKLAAATKKGGKEGKRARLAETLKNFHKSKMTQSEDDAYDRKHGIKEGSKADVKQDRENGIKDKKGRGKKK